MTVGKFIVQPCNSSQEKNLIKLKLLDMQQTKAKETRRDIHIPKKPSERACFVGIDFARSQYD